MTGVQQCVCGHGADDHLDARIGGECVGDLGACRCGFFEAPRQLPDSPPERHRMTPCSVEPVLSSLPSEIEMEDGTRVVAADRCWTCGDARDLHRGPGGACVRRDRAFGCACAEFTASPVRVESGPVVTITMTQAQFDRLIEVTRREEQTLGSYAGMTRLREGLRRRAESWARVRALLEARSDA